MANFRHCGTITVGDNFHREGTTSGGAKYQSITLGVKAGENNIAYVELFGMKTDTIKTKNKDNENIEIDWSDRTDAEIINTVANYRKHSINVSGEYSDRQEFIADYDAVQYIVDNIDDIKGKRMIVTGTTSPNVYQGKVSQRFQISNMYAAKDTDKDGLKITAEYFYDKDSIDLDDFKEDKKIYINGYINAWFSGKDLGTKACGSRYVSQQVVLDLSKIDFDNPRHLKLTNFRLATLGISPVESASDKPKVKLSKGYHSNNIEFSYQNGAEAIEFDESQLTDMQKEMVELGLKSVDDFRPAGQSYGNRVTLWKIANFNLMGKYADGMLDIDIDDDEIFTPAATEGSLDELESKIKIDEKGREIMDFEDASDEDLFD